MNPPYKKLMIPARHPRTLTLEDEIFYQYLKSIKCNRAVDIIVMTPKGICSAMYTYKSGATSEIEHNHVNQLLCYMEERIR